MARTKNNPQKYVNPLNKQLLTKRNINQKTQLNDKQSVKTRPQLAPKSTAKPMRTIEDLKSLRSIPGSHVLRDFKRFQKNRHLVIPKIAFQRFVREIAEDMRRIDGIRFQTTALLALQESAEAFLVSVFEDMDLCSKHANRVMVQKKDLYLALRLRPDSRHFRK